MWFHQEAGIFWFALTMSMSGYTLHNDFAESKTWSQMGFRSGLEIGRDSLCKTMRGVTAYDFDKIKMSQSRICL